MDENTTATGAGGEATNEGDDAGRFGRAKEFFNDKYNAASDAMRDKYNAAREKFEDADFGAILDQARSYVRSNPGKALLISVGVGFVIGLLLRRDEED